MPKVINPFSLKAEVTLKVREETNKEIRREVRKRLVAGARMIAKSARYMAPYDPNSRIAAGKSKQNWPKIHHRRSIRAIAGNMKKLSTAVTTTSNRFYFIEFPTRWNGKNAREKGKYVKVRDPRTGRLRRGHGATKRMGNNSIRTPGQPHFWPAVAMNYERIYSSLEGII